MLTRDAILELDDLMSKFRSEQIDKGQIPISEWFKNMTPKEMEYKFLLLLMHADKVIKSRL